ncbi:MAG: hypothetical protein MUC49_20945 [Raineya sp.]|jgi:hypothetical protein|nr:hypothetical protein [Raineya sp.]
MKFFLIIATFILSGICLYGQKVQRLAILPTKTQVILNKKNSSHTFKSYCVDYDRDFPSNTQYSGIVSGGKTPVVTIITQNGKTDKLTLKQALSGNSPALLIHASEELGAIFSKFSINPQRKDITKVLIGPIKTREIIAPQSDDTQDFISDIVFNTFEKDLTLLSDESNYRSIQENLWKKSLIVELLKANKKLELDASGKLSSKALALANVLEKNISKNDFFSPYDKRFYFLAKNGKIRINENGDFTEETKIFFKNFSDTIYKIIRYNLCQGWDSLSYEEIIKKVQKENNLNVTGTVTPELSNFLTEYGKPFRIIDDYLRHNKDKDIIADFNFGFNREYVIKMDDKLYFFDGRSKPSVLISDHISGMEDNYKELIKYIMSSTDNYKYIYFSSIDNNTKKLTYLTGSTENSATLKDVHSFEEIIALIDNHITGNPESKNFILARDMFTQRKLGEYDKTKPSPFGDKFIEGSNIGIEDRTWINYVELLRELQIRYPDRKFHLGGDLIKDYESINYSPKIKSADQIVAYIAPASLDISRDRVKAMSDQLSSSGIIVHELNDEFEVPGNLQQANVLLLSGHKEKAYEDFLKNIADKGLLEDKVVAVFSCNEKGTANLNSYLINKGKAKKIIFFPSTILVTAIDAVFKELAELTKELHTIPDGISFNELIDKAVDKALIKYPGDTDKVLRENIQQLKHFINQISHQSSFKHKNKNG